jgi:hypothetical protein
MNSLIGLLVADLSAFICLLALVVITIRDHKKRRQTMNPLIIGLSALMAASCICAAICVPDPVFKTLFFIPGSTMVPVAIFYEWMRSAKARKAAEKR